MSRPEEQGVHPRRGPVRLEPARGPARGTVSVPPSKSLTNRALVAAAVAGGGTVERALDCDDTRRLAEALAAMGWEVSWEGDTVRVGPRRRPRGPVAVHLGDSATGARFVLALAAVVPGETLVDGSPRLRERPMAPLLAALARLGAEVEAASADRLPVRVRGGPVAGGRVTLDPGVSSQFVSALLLAAPAMPRGLELVLEGALPSRPYVRLTEAVLEAFAAAVTRRADGGGWRVSAGGARPTVYRVEGDWSAAAFPLAAAAVAGGEVRVRGVSAESAQGDRRVVDLLGRIGCSVRWEDGAVAVRGPALAPLEADLRDTPDLFPALAAVAAAAPPGSRLEGLETLAFKESDRLAVMAANLSRLGAEVVVGPGTLEVLRPLRPPGGGPVAVTAAGDHRIAMAMAVAALRAGPAALDDGGCVAKSYPEFWSDWEGIVG